MHPHAALALARQTKYRVAPLTPCIIRLANSMEWAGRAVYTANTIELSVEYIQAYTPYQVAQITLHELAHIKRGPTRPHRLNGHDEKWERIAARLGYQHGPGIPADWPTPEIVWNVTCTNTGEILETSSAPTDDDSCKLCNACTPITERRQIVKASTYTPPPPQQIPRPVLKALDILHTMRNNVRLAQNKELLP